MRLAASILLFGLVLSAFASDEDSAGCRRGLRPRPDRAFRPLPLQTLESRVVPFIMPGSPTGLSIGLGYAGFGEYLNGIAIGGGGSSSSHAPSFIAIQAAQTVRADHIRLPGAVASVAGGARALIPGLTSSLRGFHVGNGVLVEVSVQIAASVLEVEGRHFRPALLKLEGVTAHSNAPRHVTLSGRVAHGGDSFTFSTTVPLTRQGPVSVNVIED